MGAVEEGLQEGVQQQGARGPGGSAVGGLEPARASGLPSSVQVLSTTLPKQTHSIPAPQRTLRQILSFLFSVTVLMFSFWDDFSD